MVFLIIPGNTFGSVHPIGNETPDTLETFIEDITLWNPGDTIMLTTASQYIVTGTIEIKQEITVLGDPSLSAKPVVYFYESGFQAATDSINITMKGFYAIGIEPEGVGERSMAKALLQFDMPDWSVFKNIVIEDVHIKSFRQIVQFYKNQYGQYGSFTLHNCIVDDIFGETALDFRKASVEQITITNNSFTDIEHGFFGELYYQDNTNLPAQGRYVPQDVLIDHNTFYNVAGAANKSLIQNNAGIDGSVTLVFSNNIVSTLFWEEYARPFRINSLAGTFQFNNCVFHDFNSAYEGGIYNLEYVASNNANVTTANIYSGDPVFYDITGDGEYDLTVANTLFYTIGTDNGLVGDPRWVASAEKTKHKVANTGINALEVFIEDTSLWTPGDTILIGESSTYIVTDTIDILQDIVILGDPFLEQKPVVRFYDKGFRAKSDSINITVEGFVALGIEPEDSATRTQANSLLRFDEPGQKVYGHIRIEDMGISYFDRMIGLYADKYGQYESLTINNCIVSNLGEGYAIEPNISSIEQTTITNNTFYNLEGGFLGQLYFQDLSNSPAQDRFVDQNLTIDHNTLFRVTGVDTTSLILNDAGIDGSVQLDFTNNIVSSLLSNTVAQPFLINEAAGDFMFTNSVFHNFETSYLNGKYNLDSVSNQSNVTVIACDTSYPAFLDTTISTGPDFTISNLLYLAYSTEGGLIGDPRWVPEAASTKHFVNSNDLKDFIEDLTLWTSSDTIILSESSDYIEDSTINIAQEVTIMSDPGLTEKPAIIFLENGFKVQTDSISIHLKGFKVSGIEPDSVTEKSVAPAFLRFDQPEWSVFKEITLEDIELDNFKEVIQLYTSQYGHCDSLLIDDCVFRDIDGDNALALNHSSIRKLSITNSTFINIENGFLDELYFHDAANIPAQERTINQSVLIDHNTFYRVSGNAHSSFLNLAAVNDGSVSLNFSNNIVCELFNKEVAEPFRINEDAGSLLFTNSTFFNFNSTLAAFNLDTIAKQDNVTVQFIDYSFPGFKDTASYDLHLWNYLPVRSAGTDGKEIGDPRWIPDVYPVSTSHIHPMANTNPDTLKWFIENTDIWQPGDTLLLISEGDYVENHSINIYQTITMLSDTALDTKPVIRFMDNGLRVMEDSVSVVIKDVDFNGYNSTTAEYSPYIIRYYTEPASVFYNLIIDNCNAQGFRGGIDLNDGKHSIYDSVIVNNVIWHNFNGEYCVDPNLNFPKYMKVSNSTFYDISYGFIKNPGFASATNGDTYVEKDIYIDHNTFYRVGGNNNSFVQMNDPTDNSVNFIFSNNIASTLYEQNNARPFRLNELAGSLNFINSVMHNLDVPGSSYNFSNALALSNVSATDLIYEEPGYADPTNGNFTLPDSSLLLTASTIGNIIGDPRWAPGAGASIDDETGVLSMNKSNFYPNPAKDYIQICLNSACQVIIYDITGKEQVNTWLNPNSRLDISNLRKGTYLVWMKPSGSQPEMHKLIKM